MAAAQAPSITLEASPSAVQIPGTYELIATTDRDIGPTPYWTRIYDDDRDEPIMTCGSGTQCTAWVGATWGENANPQPRHFHAATWRPPEEIGSRSEDVTVTILPADMSVELSLDPPTVTEPEGFTVTATANRDVSNTPYYLEILNADTGDLLQTCSIGTTCEWGAAGWGPRSWRLRARLRAVSGHVAAESETVTAIRKRLLFPVDLEFIDQGENRFTAHATITRDIGPTPYWFYIRDSAGRIQQCSQGTTCDSGVLEIGETYRATVESADGQVVVGDSGAWTLTLDGPRRDVVDDVDIGHLAALFASTTAVCNALAEYPGSHVMSPPSTLSDQYRICVAGATAGRPTRDVLIDIAKGVGGAAAIGALWYLRSQAVRPLPDPGAPPTSEESRAPKPVPLPLLPQTYDLASELVDANQSLSQAHADDVAHQCLFLVGRLAANARRRCADLPIFVSGSDVAEATEHDLEALARRPMWVGLNYRRSDETPGPRQWYLAEAECSGGIPAGQACDEYPFWATMQGGSPVAGAFRPSLKIIDAGDNSLQGARYGHFVVACTLVTGDPFLGIPLHPSLGVPTQTRICNN